MLNFRGLLRPRKFFNNENFPTYIRYYRWFHANIKLMYVSVCVMDIDKSALTHKLTGNCYNAVVYKASVTPGNMVSHRVIWCHTG